jgi:hypothetical protein
MNAFPQIELQKNMMPLFCMVPSECVPCVDASWRLRSTTMLTLTWASKLHYRKKKSKKSSISLSKNDEILPQKRKLVLSIPSHNLLLEGSWASDHSPSITSHPFYFMHTWLRQDLKYAVTSIEKKVIWLFIHQEDVLCCCSRTSKL